MMQNVFFTSGVQEFENRINALTPNAALWGKMDVAKMLAHCNVTYETAFENKHSKPNFFYRFFLRAFLKEIVTNEKPFKKKLGNFAGI